MSVRSPGQQPELRTTAAGREAGPPHSPTRTVVLGMGNPVLSDDAIGIVLAKRLNSRLREIPGVDVIQECCVGGLNLLELLEGYDRMVVLDSIKTIGGTPGNWYAFDATSLRETMNLRNVHDANFATALALGREMGNHLPSDEECHIVAIEIADNMTFAEKLTPALQTALPQLLIDIEAHVLELLDTHA